MNHVQTLTLFCKLTWALCWSSNSTTSACPFSDAIINAVYPFFNVKRRNVKLDAKGQHEKCMWNWPCFLNLSEHNVSAICRQLLLDQIGRPPSKQYIHATSQIRKRSKSPFSVDNTIAPKGSAKKRNITGLTSSCLSTSAPLWSSRLTNARLACAAMTSAEQFYSEKALEKARRRLIKLFISTFDSYRIKYLHFRIILKQFVDYRDRPLFTSWHKKWIASLSSGFGSNEWGSKEWVRE